MSRQNPQPGARSREAVAPGAMAPHRRYVDNGGMNLLQGQDATCPHCGETIDLTLDLSVSEQSYIEDCPVCCKPMMVSYTAVDGEVAEFSVESAE
jgi:hypothetical protein